MSENVVVHLNLETRFIERSESPINWATIISHYIYRGRKYDFSISRTDSLVLTQPKIQKNYFTHPRCMFT